MLKKRFGFIQLRKEFFLCLKFSRMHTAPAAAQFHGMLEVQHFVVNDVFDRVARNSRVVEDPTDNYGIVRRIVVAESVASVIAAPGHLWSSQQAIKESPVQIF